MEAHRAESYNEAYAVERDRGILAIRQGITSTRQEYLKLVGQEPARLDYAFQKMEEMIRASGLRPDLIEQEVLAARRAIFTSYRQARLASPNPESLLREMEAGRFEGIVPPEEMEALVVQTTAEVGQRQRAALMERQVDADTRQRLELQRLRAGEGGDPHITPDALREIFPGEVGERKARQLEEELAVAEKFNELANAPAEERNKVLEAVGGPDSVAEAAVDEAPGAEDSAERTANREAASTGPRGERGDAPSEGEATRAPDLQFGSGVDLDALAQLTPEQRDEVIGREQGPNFQGERPPDPVRGVAAAPDSEAANAVRRAVAKLERSLENDSKQHVRAHDKDIREVDAKAEAARAYANRPDLSPEERKQARQEAARATQYAVALSDARQTEIKGSDIGNRVLTKADAAEKARELASLDFDGQVAWWQDIDEYYGPSAGRVLNEVVASGLTLDQKGTALLVVYGAEQKRLDQWKVAVGRGLEELRREARSAHGPFYWYRGPTHPGLRDERSTFSDLDQIILEHAREFVSVFEAAGRGQEGRERLEMTRLLAWQMALDGKHEAGPAADAVRVFFPFEAVHDSAVVPIDVLEKSLVLQNGRAVENVLDRKLREMTDDVVGFSFAGVRNDLDLILNRSQMERLYADHVRGHGRWRNTCNGVQLVDGGGRPVKYKDGGFVAFTWDEIDTMARDEWFARQPKVGPERAADLVPLAAGFSRV